LALHISKAEDGKVHIVDTTTGAREEVKLSPRLAQVVDPDFPIRIDEDAEETGRFHYVPVS
jgi:hypothetical protein